MENTAFIDSSSKFDFIDSDIKNVSPKKENHLKSFENHFENIKYQENDDDDISNSSAKYDRNLESPMCANFQGEPMDEKKKPKEAKFLILETPDGVDTDNAMYILSQLPFFDKLDDVNKDETNGSIEKDISLNLINSSNKTIDGGKKVFGQFDLEASAGDDDSNNLLRSLSRSSAMNKNKLKIENDEILKFWKSKQHCIRFSKMTLSLLFSNIGLTLLVTAYILLGAWVFKTIESAEELLKYKKYSYIVASQMRDSNRTILTRHDKIILELRNQTYKNVMQMLELKVEESSKNLDKILSLLLVANDSVTDAHVFSTDQVKEGVLCKDASNQSCESRNATGNTESMINVTEYLKLLNTKFDIILKQIDKVTNSLNDLKTANNINKSLVLSEIKQSFIHRGKTKFNLGKVLDNMIDTVQKATKEGWIHDFIHFQGEDELSRIQWTYGGSILYCITIITTIGYGHITPRTTFGRIFTIIYAIFGIPIMLICLTHIGSLMADMFRLIYRLSCLKAVKRYRKSQKSKKGKINVQPPDIYQESLEDGATETKEISVTVVKKSPISNAGNSGNILQFRKILLHIPNPNRLLEAAKESKSVEVPVSLVIIVFLVYNLIGSIFFHICENWTFIDSFYFSFITLSTIGFGDLVPVVTGGEAEQYKSIMCSFYVLFGLSLCVMSFDLMEKKCRSAYKVTIKKIRQLISKKDQKPKKTK